MSACLVVPSETRASLTRAPWMRPLACLLLFACARPDSGGTCPAGTAPPSAAATETTGVLIVGAGPAGLAAAHEATLAGREYVVLEREDFVGGSAVWAGGSLLFAGTPEQEALGIVDSPDRLLSEWAEMTGGDPEAPWVQAYARNAGAEVHDWLVDLGLQLLIRDSAPDVGSVPRAHEPVGNGVALVAALEGEVDLERVLLTHEVTALYCEEGRIVGAGWHDRVTDALGWTKADAVVMATGGFLRDRERVAQVRPGLAGIDLWESSAPVADGNGLDLVGAVGGTTTNLAAVGLYAHGTDDYRRPGDREELAISELPHTLWVDQAGERFFNEDHYASFDAGEAVVSASGGLAWILFDSRIEALLTLSDPLVDSGDSAVDPTFEAAIDAGGNAFSRNTLADLAQDIDVPDGALTATVLTYGQGAATGDALGKDADSVMPLTTPPFYAFRLVPAVAKGFGGVTVGTDGAVLDDAGAAIPGLYAAGELTGMAGGSMVGDRGFTGSLSAVIYSGRVAGRAASAE